MGNIPTQVTEPILQEVFASTGPVEGCKLIRKEKVYFQIPVRTVCFIDLNLKYEDFHLTLLCLCYAVILWIHSLL